MSVTLDAPCPELHVLVLDDDPVVRLAHTEMVRTLEPCARVTAVASVAEAIGAVEQFSGSQPVQLVLLDLDLSGQTADDGWRLPLCLSEDPRSGLTLANQIDPLMGAEPGTDFRAKPLVAVVSGAISQPSHLRAVCNRGADVAVAKPLKLRALKVMIDASGAADIIG